MKAQLRFEEIRHFLIGLVKTEPHHAAALVACRRAQFIDSNIPHPLAIPIEGAGDDPSSRRRICSLGGEVEYVSQIFCPNGRVRWIHAARCRGPRGSGWS